MSTVEIERMAKKKQQSRDIVKEIINFGVSEDQKLDIIYLLSLSLESVEAMKTICDATKNYKKNINIDEDNDNNLDDSKNKKLLL